MMAEYAELLAEPVAERPSGTPVWPDRPVDASPDCAIVESSPLLPLPLWFLVRCG